MTAVVRGLRAWSPWAPGEALRWVVVGLAGHTMWIAGWILAAYERSFGAQYKWATLAAGGFVVAAYADITWLLRARVSVVDRRRMLLPDVEDAMTSSAVQQVADGFVVAGPDLARFHRPECALATAKSWPAVAREQAVADGQLPCGVCDA